MVIAPLLCGDWSGTEIHIWGGERPNLLITCLQLRITETCYSSKLSVTVHLLLNNIWDTLQMLYLAGNYINKL